MSKKCVYVYAALHALTLERLELQTSLLLCRLIPTISRSRSSMKVMSQGQSYMSVTKYTHAVGLPSTKLKSNLVHCVSRVRRFSNADSKIVFGIR